MRPMASHDLNSCLLLLFSLILTIAAEKLVSPPEVDCFDQAGPGTGGEVSLVVKETRWNVDGIMSFNTRAYWYNGVPYIPAPTIRMRPHQRCRVHISNQLSAAGSAHCGMMANRFHCGDVTSLHTHGLHVSPQQDNIGLPIYPGNNRTYSYELPPDHLMGLFWYHPHTHGAAALQIGGGMVGMLTVEPSLSYWASMPADLKALYDRANNPYYYEMAIQHVFFGPSDRVYGDYDMSMTSYPDISAAYGASQTIDPAPTFQSSIQNFLTVNGQYNPSVNIVAGSTALVRLLYSGPWRFLVLMIEKVDGAHVCNITLLARDGIFQQAPYLNVTRMAFHPAGRADYAIYCNPPTNVPLPLTLRVYATDNINETESFWQMVQYQHSVFQLDVFPAGHGNVTAPLMVPTSYADMPAYLSDLRNETVVPSEGLYVDMDSRKLNGKKFLGLNVPLPMKYFKTFCLNKAYMLNIEPQPLFNVFIDRRRRAQMTHGDDDDPVPLANVYNTDAGIHPFHQHINAFQMISVHGQDAPGTPQYTAVSPEFIRIGEWRDTVGEPLSGVVARFKPDRYAGEVIFHCHYLEHEDLGMMGMYRIESCGLPSEL